MPNINRGSTENNNWQSWDVPELQQNGVGPRPSESSATTSAQETKGNTATPFKKPADDVASPAEDSAFERNARELIGRLAQGDSLELKLGGELKKGDTYKLEATAKIERQDDGSVTVELEGEGKVGGSGDLASGKIGVAAGTKLHFKTAAEAADFLDAFGKAGALTAANSSLASAFKNAHDFGVKGDWVDAHARLVGHLSKTKEVKGEGIAEATLGKEKDLYGFAGLEAKAAVKAKDGFKLDLKNNTFTRTQTLSLDASADLKLGWLNVGGGGKATVTVSTTYKLTDAELKAVKSGQLTPALLVPNGSPRVPTEQKIKAELELNQKGDAAHIAGEDLKTKLSVEKVIDEKTFSGGLEKTLNELGDLKWKAEIDIGMGVATNELKVDAEVVKLEASAKYRHREALSGEYSLTEWVPRLKQQSDDQMLMAGLRASAGL